MREYAVQKNRYLATSNPLKSSEVSFSLRASSGQVSQTAGQDRTKNVGKRELRSQRVKWKKRARLENRYLKHSDLERVTVSASDLVKGGKPSTGEN